MAPGTRSSRIGKRPEPDNSTLEVVEAHDEVSNDQIAATRKRKRQSQEHVFENSSMKEGDTAVVAPEARDSKQSKTSKLQRPTKIYSASTENRRKSTLDTVYNEVPDEDLVPTKKTTGIQSVQEKTGKSKIPAARKNTVATKNGTLKPWDRPRKDVAVIEALSTQSTRQTRSKDDMAEQVKASSTIQTAAALFNVTVGPKSTNSRGAAKQGRNASPSIEETMESDDDNEYVNEGDESEEEIQTEEPGILEDQEEANRIPQIRHSPETTPRRSKRTPAPTRKSVEMIETSRASNAAKSTKTKANHHSDSGKNTEAYKIPETGMPVDVPDPKRAKRVQYQDDSPYPQTRQEEEETEEADEIEEEEPEELDLSDDERLIREALQAQELAQEKLDKFFERVETIFRQIDVEELQELISETDIDPVLDLLDTKGNYKYINFDYKPGQRILNTRNHVLPLDPYHIYAKDFDPKNQRVQELFKDNETVTRHINIMKGCKQAQRQHREHRSKSLNAVSTLVRMMERAQTHTVSQEHRLKNTAYHEVEFKAMYLDRRKAYSNQIKRATEAQKHQGRRIALRIGGGSSTGDADSEHLIDDDEPNMLSEFGVDDLLTPISDDGPSTIGDVAVVEARRIQSLRSHEPRQPLEDEGESDENEHRATVEGIHEDRPWGYEEEKELVLILEDQGAWTDDVDRWVFIKEAYGTSETDPFYERSAEDIKLRAMQIKAELLNANAPFGPEWEDIDPHIQKMVTI